MSRIKIKNFGPINNGFSEEWIEIKKVTVFIGNQGSGKSTIAKLISTFSWIEKALYKQGLTKAEVKRKSKFENYYCEYQNLKNYFKNNTEIEFEGNYFKFIYNNGRLNIEDIKKGKYLVPKIMYVPAERNFVSAVSQPEKLRNLPKTLYTFLEEYERAKQELSDNLDLPINNLKFQYEKKKNESKIIGSDYDLPLHQASSGLQSSIPLFLVSKNLSENIDSETDNSKTKISVEEKEHLRQRILAILRNEKLTDDIRSEAIEILSSVTKNDCFINIVEEPEQNLFPTSQRAIINSLNEFNSLNEGNNLIITTHSPYILNYLTLAVKANHVLEKVKASGKLDLVNKISEIVPHKSIVRSENLVIYELDDNGNVILLPEYKGIPSDENFLNEKLADTNYLFTDLLEIEDLCQ